jgi:hypothetical protein
METKTLIERLEQIEFDAHSMTHYPLNSILEKVESVAAPISEETWVEYEPYGRKRFAKLVFDTQPTQLTLTIEQTGGDGVYATYFTYEHIKQ